MTRPPSKIDPTLGNNIQSLMAMDVNVHSQPLLAKKSGVSQSTIGRIIRGEVSPSSDNVKRIADALGVDVAMLYTDVEKLGLGMFREERVRAQESRFVARKSGKTPLVWDLHVREDSAKGRRIELKESPRKGVVIGEVDDGYAVRLMSTVDDRAPLHGAYLLVEQTGVPASEDLCLVRLKSGETYLQEFSSDRDPDDFFFESMWGQSIAIPRPEVEWIHGVVAIASPRQWRPR